MARISKGILGGVSGTVGTVVGSNWRGIDYIRSKPTIKAGQSNPAQLVPRMRFSIAAKFLKPFNDLLRVTYTASGRQMTELNSAFGYTIQNAVTGVFPDLRIDYSRVLLATGVLPNAIANPITADPAGILKFQWTDNSGTGLARADDKAVVIAYSEELNQGIDLVGPAMRSEAAADLPVLAFRGRTVHTWLSFIAANGKHKATSIYTGSILVP